MSTCDHCGEEDPNPRRVLRNVYYSDELFSKLISRLVLCEQCYTNVETNENYEI